MDRLAIKEGKNSFYIGESPDNMVAEITFSPVDERRITIDHTFVSESLRGDGIGRQLVNKVAEWARHENRKIIPKCPYAKKIMSQSDEYRDVLVQN